MLAIFAIIGLIILFVELSPLAENGGSLCLTLLFWVGIVQGCIAISAVCDMVRAKWIASVKRELLSVYPLLLFGAILFLLLIPFIDLYPWAGKEGVWLNKWFFIARNFVILLLAYIFGRKYALMSHGEDERKPLFATFYPLVYVISQSLMAFDWVMSLEYPWYSTLFGAYFFTEALYGGLAVSGILFLFIYMRHSREIETGRASDLQDLGTLIFGFSLLWAGLFYAQYLVIWYGNLPEEVSFLVNRITISPFREISLSVITLYFFIPFLVLLSKRTKSNPYVVTAVSLAILSGIFLERFLFLAPVISLSLGALVIDFSCLLFLFIILVMKGTLRKEHTAAKLSF
jgi:hypothetical protein